MKVRLVLIFGAPALLGCGDTGNHQTDQVDRGGLHDQQPTTTQRDQRDDRSGPGNDLSDERNRAEGTATNPNPNGANPPFQQNENADDLKTTAAIRRAILDAENLGTGADNAIITTNGGVVTLRGSVASDAEKQQVEQIARGVTGVSRVDNQLQVGSGNQQNGATGGATGNDADENRTGTDDTKNPGTTTPSPR